MRMAAPDEASHSLLQCLPALIRVPRQAEVLFESAGHVQKYILNRPKKYNALNVSMLDLLRPHVIVS